MVGARAALLVATLLAACGGQKAGSNAADASLPSLDAASAFPRDGFGAISGDCDVLDTELEDPMPSLFRGSFDFERGFEMSDEALLSAGGQRMEQAGNAGGSSVFSEIFAYEYLFRCEDAALLKTETEIDYDPVGKITDLEVEIDQHKIGVSVTRAVGFPFDAPYSAEQATSLLQGKLSDILESSANVSAADRWSKQILAVLSFSPMHSDVVESAYAQLDAQVRADSVLLIITTNGADDFIYCDGPC